MIAAIIKLEYHSAAYILACMKLALYTVYIYSTHQHCMKLTLCIPWEVESLPAVIGSLLAVIVSLPAVIGSLLAVIVSLQAVIDFSLAIYHSSLDVYSFVGCLFILCWVLLIFMFTFMHIQFRG